MGWGKRKEGGREGRHKEFPGSSTVLASLQVSSSIHCPLYSLPICLMSSYQRVKLHSIRVYRRCGFRQPGGFCPDHWNVKHILTQYLRSLTGSCHFWCPRKSISNNHQIAFIMGNGASICKREEQANLLVKHLKILLPSLSRLNIRIESKPSAGSKESCMRWKVNWAAGLEVKALLTKEVRMTLCL